MQSVLGLPSVGGAATAAAGAMSGPLGSVLGIGLALAVFGALWVFSRRATVGESDREEDVHDAGD